MIIEFNELERYFFGILHDGLEIDEFERWVYSNNDLENILNEEDYLNLISLNFRSKHIKYEIEKILVKYIDFSKYEKNRVLTQLHRALESKEDLPYILMEFYDMYCHGYYFFEALGLRYGLNCEVTPSKYASDKWDGLNEKEKDELIIGFFPQLESDLLRAIHWIENGKIVLTGTKDELDCWEFIDYRNDEEKRSKFIIEVPNRTRTKVLTKKKVLTEQHKKKWWKFWGK